MTASEDNLDISGSYNLGAYAYLVKPVTFPKLHEAVLRLKSCSYELSVPANSGEAARSAVIVMADDNPEACLEATKTLQAAGLGNPLTYVTNRAALMDHLHGRHVFGGDVPAPAAGSGAWRKRMTRPDITESTVLLMADDDPADCLLTEKALRKAEITCPLYVVHDGAELMDFLKARGRLRRSGGGAPPEPDPARPQHAEGQRHRGAGASA
ncbi:hypothetical protein GBAR_LOCUS30212 [Geodia barretti]|uniref:Response regulatory domain-containing protein n=1 Tax=Geodia barretti TaxID=519541 RepID=A0AA35TX56_GEOBA|nr:hypothetical protein GBAR_LOCUS30212 [Geodia barretti]